MNRHPLGSIGVESFLNEYWQKKPLLIRNALDDIKSPISADELAGLACEEDIESRLIINHSETWQLQHGPFNENTFSQLPPSHWTLLVQAVDHYVPAAGDLLALFEFIPRWRIDDLMVSYASTGGGVGPHFDNYDVFLVQTKGKRRWEIGGHYDDDAALEEGLPVKIIKDFTPEQSWILEAGDILYLPPGIGHNGISESDDCMTCSVGFQAPSHSELVREYADFIANELASSLRYQDTELSLQENSGAISQQALTEIENILRHYTQDSSAIHDWFARYITMPKYHQLNELELPQSDQSNSTDELMRQLNNNHCLQRNESSRFAFLTHVKHQLFVDGHLIPTNPSNDDLIELICQQRRISVTEFKPTDDNLDLLLQLINRGALYLDQN